MVFISQGWCVIAFNFLIRIMYDNHKLHTIFIHLSIMFLLAAVVFV